MKVKEIKSNNKISPKEKTYPKGTRVPQPSHNLISKCDLSTKESLSYGQQVIHKKKKNLGPSIVYKWAITCIHHMKLVGLQNT